MSCEPIVKNGKIVGFMCTRGKLTPSEKIEKELKAKRCYKCGKPAKRFCDYRGGYRYIKGYQDETGIHPARELFDLHTCDKPMCNNCANRYENDLDFCDLHNNEMSIRLSQKAERAFQRN